MFPNSDKKFQKVVQKHGNALNQRSSFYHLMKQKTKRGEKTVGNKQNEDKIQILQHSLQKYSYTAEQKRFKPQQKDVFSIIPLTNMEISNQKYVLNEMIDEKPIDNVLTCENSLQMTQQGQFKIIQPLITEAYYPPIKITAQVACMTDESYQEKQLAIKIKILKKQRDQLWQSITDILKENQDLKHLLSEHERKKIQSICVNTQTESIKYSTYEIQTDIDFHQLDKIYSQISRISEEKQELFTFFSQLPLQSIDLKKESFGCLDLTGIFIQTLNSQLSFHSKEWQAQKSSLKSYYDQQINYLKIIEQKYGQSNEQLSGEVSQLRQIKRQLQQQLQISFRKVNFLEQANSNLTIKLAQKTEQVKDLTIVNTNLNTYMDQQKAVWNEKNKKYSRLLGQSHKTIQNLVNQMKDFEQLACQTYSKYLQTNRLNHMNL